MRRLRGLPHVAVKNNLAIAERDGARQRAARQGERWRRRQVKPCLTRTNNHRCNEQMKPIQRLGGNEARERPGTAFNKDVAQPALGESLENVARFVAIRSWCERDLFSSRGQSDADTWLADDQPTGTIIA
jgi:hypothetical protein